MIKQYELLFTCKCDRVNRIVLKIDNVKQLLTSYNVDSVKEITNDFDAVRKKKVAEIIKELNDLYGEK